MKQTTLLLTTGLLLCILFSCNDAGNQPKQNTAEKIKISNQGVDIAYDDSQAGDTCLLFIHGWAIDRTCWAEQVNYFSKKYRVVTVDLPGFGQSGKNRKSWTVEDYGKDISAVLNTLDLKNVILTGHSMSGAIIVETALTNPSRIIGIVGVDNFKQAGFVETPQSKVETEAIYQKARANYKSTISRYVAELLFSPSTDSIVKKKIINEITGADSVIAMNCLEQSDRYPLSEKLKAVKLPLNLINSDFTSTDTTALKLLNPGYHLYNVGPTGHYPMLEKPAAFNALLQQAIAGMRR